MIILTIDTDWAPEAATRAVLEKVRGLGLKTTVFFSTPSPIPAWPLLEVGCHPDLSRRRTLLDEDGGLGLASLDHDQAVDAAEGAILDDYRLNFPQAKALRTHRFYWHSDLSRNLSAHGFEHDSSMILPYHPGLKGFRVGRLCRWPVWASDHLHLARRLPLGRLAMPHWDAPGLKIFCFHVAYLHLNVSSLGDFNMIKERLGQEEEPADSARPGIWDLFEMLAGEIHKRANGYWLSDIPADYLTKGNLAPDEL